MKYKKTIIFMSVFLIFSFILLWKIHFQYSGFNWNSVVTNKYKGYVKNEILNSLGAPDKIYNGYSSIGLAPNLNDANQTHYYKTFWGCLYVYYKDNQCVESLYFDNSVQF